MKARESRLNNLLEIRNQKFVIPVFQRKYSWTEKQCQTLWDDILKLSDRGIDAGHFIGSIVCYQLNDEEMPGVINEKILIDGQQRLTTLSLIMIAIARTYKSLGVDGERIANTILNQYILNNDFTGEDKYKLIPTYDDKETFIALINGREKELKNYSKNMIDNFNLFYDYLDGDQELLQKVYKGINKLDIVYVVLTKNQDNPQLIFESMNSTGKGLSQGDLLRNYLLLGLNSNEQQELYETYWKPIEQDFGQDDYTLRFDFFLRDYLTMLERKTVKLDIGYDEFKEYYEDKGLSKKDILINLRKYSKYYTRIYRCIDEDSELNELWKELKIQRVDVANPFLMQVYSDYEESLEKNEFKLSKDDFIKIIKTVNSYVYRRYIVGIPTNSLNKTFAVLYNSINKQDYKNSVIAALMLLDSYKKFPDDAEFADAFAKRELYTLRLKNYTLEKLENYNHLNPIVIDGNDISIEHILPETDPNNFKQWWKDALGENWRELQKTYVHRVGNLTLTKNVYNTQMKDYDFLKKLNVEGGIAASHYRLSDSVIFDTDENGNYLLDDKGARIKRTEWNISDIEERTKILVKQALDIWKYPLLTENELKPYKNISRQEKVVYEDISHLPQMNSIINDVFNKYDEFISCLDEKVTKLITKHYIAYKYDYSNFVEIIIYKNSINIILDIPEDLINDEMNLAENISDKGSWGTGNLRIKVNNLENFDYIKNLILQSLNNEKHNC